MRRLIGTILTALGIFGFFYGIFDWHIAGRGLTGSGGYYYYDETKIIIAISAVVVFAGVLLIRRRKQ